MSFLFNSFNGLLNSTPKVSLEALNISSIRKAFYSFISHWGSDKMFLGSEKDLGFIVDKSFNEKLKNSNLLFADSGEKKGRYSKPLRESGARSGRWFSRHDFKDKRTRVGG